MPLSLEKQPSLLELANPNGIQAKFEKYHADNPRVYEILRELALADVAAGRKVSGIDLYVSQLRWRMRVETHGDTFKFNNNYRSRYARLLMANEPALAGAFEIRSLLSA